MLQLDNKSETDAHSANSNFHIVAMRTVPFLIVDYGHAFKWKRSSSKHTALAMNSNASSICSKSTTSSVAKHFLLRQVAADKRARRKQHNTQYAMADRPHSKWNA